MSGGTIKLRLLFVDDGEFHREEIEVPGGAAEDYERLIDFILEDPDVLHHLHVDSARLVAVYRA